VTRGSVLWHRDAGALIEIFLPFEREDEEDCACSDRSLLHCDRKIAMSPPQISTEDQLDWIDNRLLA